jgi:glutamine amidotransferase
MYQQALQHTINTIIDLQFHTLGEAAAPNDLNVAVTDGTQLVAVRYRNHPSEQPPSLYFSTTAGVTLNRKYPDHPDGAKGPHGPGKDTGKGEEGHNPKAHKKSQEHGEHVIVASEPTTYKDKDWELIEKNHAILVSGDKVEVRELSVPKPGKSQE